jgi:hypothetical protein
MAFIGTFFGAVEMFFFFLKHMAKTMTTEAASVSLNRFTCNPQAK